MKRRYAAERHPGFHRRREIRLRDEEEFRLFRRQQRRFESALGDLTGRTSAQVIAEIAAEGMPALAHLSLH